MFLFPAVPALDLSPGYYRLSQIVTSAKQAGISVTVASSCGQAIYGVALKDVPWTSVVEALRADGTLEVLQAEEGWRIRPNVATEKEEAREAKAYLGQLADGYAAPYLAAKKRIDAIYAQPASRWGAMSATGGRDFVSSLARDQFMDNSVHYARVSLPGKVTQMMRKGPSTPPLRGPMWALVDLLIPKGFPKEADKYFLLRAPDEESAEDKGKREAFLRQLPADLRWHLDPQTGGVSYELGALMPFQSVQGVPYNAPCRESFFSGSLTDAEFVPTLSLRSLFGEEKLAAVEARTLASESLLRTDGRFSAPLDVDLPESSFSDKLLRTAGAKGWNVLFRPSSFFNMRLSKGRSATFAECWREAFDLRTILKDAEVHGADRLGSEPLASRLVLAPRFSLMTRGEVLVVRDEQRFLEVFADGEVLLSPEIANIVLEGSTVPFEKVVDAVALMNPKTWRMGIMASSVLDVCHPATFYPFAKLFKASPAFRQAVASAGKKAVRLPLAKLSSAEREIFGASLLAMEPISTDRDNSSSPSGAYAHLTNLPLAQLWINIDRSNDGIAFEMMRDGEYAWRSSVSLASMRKQD